MEGSKQMHIGISNTSTYVGILLLLLYIRFVISLEGRYFLVFFFFFFAFSIFLCHHKLRFRFTT